MFSPVFRKTFRKIERFLDRRVSAAFFPFRLVLRDTGLSQFAYSDPREVMLYAVAECIKMHVEDPWFEHVDWNYSEEHQKDYMAATHFYNWWKYSRPNRYDIMDSYHGEAFEFVPSDTPGFQTMVFDPEFSKLNETANKFEVYYDEEDQRMLKMVIDRRLGLWT